MYKKHYEDKDIQKILDMVDELVDDIFEQHNKITELGLVVGLIAGLSLMFIGVFMWLIA